MVLRSAQNFSQAQSLEWPAACLAIGVQHSMSKPCLLAIIHDIIYLDVLVTRLLRSSCTAQLDYNYHYINNAIAVWHIGSQASRPCCESGWIPRTSQDGVHAVGSRLLSTMIRAFNSSRPDGLCRKCSCASPRPKLRQLTTTSFKTFWMAGKPPLTLVCR